MRAGRLTFSPRNHNSTCRALPNSAIFEKTNSIRLVSHPYSDAPEDGITARCYSYEEVFAEKVRAFAERARPRDLYDVINLFRHDEFHPAASVIHDGLTKKCAFKGIPFPTLATLATLHDELVADWSVMLTHQLPSLPPVDAFWSELPALIAWIEQGRQPVIPAAFPLSPGDVVIRPAAGAIAIPGMASSAPIEVIRFAASNRLCVELDYVDEQGKRGVRTIEPYSLRRTQAGDIILHAVRIDNQQHRSYRIDRIRGARATQRTFAPRYAVELTPAGPISAPMATYGPRISSPARSPASGGRSTFTNAASATSGLITRSVIQNCALTKIRTAGLVLGRHGVWVDTK